MSAYLTSKRRRCKCGRPAMFLARVCRFCWRRDPSVGPAERGTA